MWRLSLFLFSLQRAKRCTRDRCCQSLPSPWQSASWEPCVWPSTAATSEKINTQITLIDIHQNPGTYVSLCKVTVYLVRTYFPDIMLNNTVVKTNVLHHNQLDNQLATHNKVYYEVITSSGHRNYDRSKREATLFIEQQSLQMEEVE